MGFISFGGGAGAIFLFGDISPPPANASLGGGSLLRTTVISTDSVQFWTYILISVYA